MFDRELTAFLASCAATVQSEEYKRDPQRKLAVAFKNLSKLENTTRKVTIVSDTSLFYEDIRSGGTLIKVGTDVRRFPDEDISNIAEVGGHTVETDICVETLDAQELACWFHAAKQMINDGKIKYVPLVVATDYDPDSGPTAGYLVGQQSRREVFDPSDFHCAVPEGDLTVTDSTMVPLFNLSLPGIEGISLENLNKLMNDHPDKLLGFRNFLLDKILDVKAALGSDEFTRSIRKIEVEIDEATRCLRSEYASLNKVTALRAIGGIVLPWTLYVFALMPGAPDILRIIGPGGMLANLSITASEFLKKHFSLGSNPVDFLIVLEKTREDK